jgi:hypothetical protein
MQGIYNIVLNCERKNTFPLRLWKRHDCVPATIVFNSKAESPREYNKASRRNKKHINWMKLGRLYVGGQIRNKTVCMWHD